MLSSTYQYELSFSCFTCLVFSILDPRGVFLLDSLTMRRKSFWRWREAMEVICAGEVRPRQEVTHYLLGKCRRKWQFMRKHLVRVNKNEAQWMKNNKRFWDYHTVLQTRFSQLTSNYKIKCEAFESCGRHIENQGGI